MGINRRRFLKQAAVAGMPFILPSHVWAAPVKPNDRMTLAFIGTGNQFSTLVSPFLYEPVQALVACDCDTFLRESAQQRINEFYKGKPEKGSPCCEAIADFQEVIARKDIDLICVATPNHWHAYITIAALKAGKDVYCEKPLTHTVQEAVQVMKTVRETGRILQTGSMQRSMNEFRVACELVRNGCIGKISHVDVYFDEPGRPYDMKEEPVEPGLDWNRWVGPARMVPFNRAVIFRPAPLKPYARRWREFKEFCGGYIANWGSHHIDIAQWGLDMDASGPVTYIPPEKPDAQWGAEMVYANGVRMFHKPGFSQGVTFYGSDGKISVYRGIFHFERDGKVISHFWKKGDPSSCGAEVAKAEREYLKDAKVKLYRSRSHVENFIKGVKTRQPTISNAEVGGHTAICCNLLSEAYYHRQRLQWNPVALKLVEGDNKWTAREYRDWGGPRSPA